MCAAILVVKSGSGSCGVDETTTAPIFLLLESDVGEGAGVGLIEFGHPYAAWFGWWVKGSGIPACLAHGIGGLGRFPCCIGFGDPSRRWGSFRRIALMAGLFPR